MDVMERCARCDEPTERRPAAYSSKSLCVVCAEIAQYVDAAYGAGQRTFWRFVPVDADEPTPFVVERLDRSYLQTDFADRPYHRGWLKFCAFTSRTAALVYRLERLDARERLHADAIEAARCVLDRLRTERHERLARRERILARIHAEAETEPPAIAELPARTNDPDADGSRSCVPGKVRERGARRAGRNLRANSCGRSQRSTACCAGSSIPASWCDGTGKGLRISLASAGSCRRRPTPCGRCRKICGRLDGT